MRGGSSLLGSAGRLLAWWTELFIIFLFCGFGTHAANTTSLVQPQCLYVANLKVSSVHTSFGVSGSLMVYDVIDGHVVRNVSTIPSALGIDEQRSFLYAATYSIIQRYNIGANLSSEDRVCQCSLITTSLDNPFVRGMDVNLSDGTLYFSYLSELCWIQRGELETTCYDYKGALSDVVLGQLVVDDYRGRIYVLDDGEPTIFVFALTPFIELNLPFHPFLVSAWQPLGSSVGPFAGLTMGPENQLYVGAQPDAANNFTSLIKIDPTTGDLVARLTLGVGEEPDNFTSSRSLIWNPMSEYFYIGYNSKNYLQYPSRIDQFILFDDNGTLIESNRSTLVTETTEYVVADTALGPCPYITPPSPAPSSPQSGLQIEAVVLPVVLGSALILLIIAIIIALIYLKCYLKRRRYFDEAKHHGESNEDIEMDDMNKYSYREVDWADLTMGKLLGQGAFGKVYKGEYRGAPVAVKLFEGVKLGEADERLLKELRSEAEMMERLSNHPNIVKFVGAITQSESHAACFALVVEYCPRGSMFQLLIKKKRRLPLITLVQMARDAASGILHLHKEHVIHRDIASRNMLVGRNFEVYVSDFGLARVKEAELEVGTTKQEFGPIAWMAPEALKSRQYSEATDAYSFGVLLWEMMARKRPWAGVEPAQIVNAVLSNTRPKIPRDCDPVFKQIIKKCWKHNPAQRPSFEKIVSMLTSYHQSLREIQRLDSQDSDESEDEDSDSNPNESNVPMEQLQQCELEKELRVFLQQLILDREDDFTMVEKATISVLSSMKARQRNSRSESPASRRQSASLGDQPDQIKAKRRSTRPKSALLEADAYTTVISPPPGGDGGAAAKEAAEAAPKATPFDIYTSVLPAGEVVTENSLEDVERARGEKGKEEGNAKTKGKKEKLKTKRESWETYASTTQPPPNRQAEDQPQARPPPAGMNDTSSQVYITVPRN